MTDDRFYGLAFPVVKVRYRGPTNTRGARWSASCDGHRISRPYDDGLPTGAQNAAPVARELWERLRADRPDREIPTASDYVAIPLNLDNDTYGFAFVDAYILNRDAS